MTLLPLAAVAARLQRDPSTVRRWCATGTLPATKCGGRNWLVREEDLLKFVPPPLGPEKRKK